MKYKFLKRYRYKSKNYKPGDELELSEAEARKINRDEPGTLELIPQKPKPRQVEKPPRDRMVKGATKTRTVKKDE